MAAYEVRYCGTGPAYEVDCCGLVAAAVVNEMNWSSSVLAYKKGYGVGL